MTPLATVRQEKEGLQRPETRDLLKCRVDPTLLINTVLPVNGVFKEIGVRDPATVLATMLPDETRVTCGNKDHVIDRARIKASMQRCNSARAASRMNSADLSVRGPTSRSIEAISKKSSWTTRKPWLTLV